MFHKVILYEKQKNKNKILGIDNFWNLLDRNDKKKIISKYIKAIEITTDDKYNIAIKDIVFYKEFIKYGNKSFWVRGYYVSTVGLNKQTIQKHIKEQETEDMIQNKKSVKEYNNPFEE